MSLEKISAAAAIYSDEYGIESIIKSNNKHNNTITTINGGGGGNSNNEISKISHMPAIKLLLP